MRVADVYGGRRTLAAVAFASNGSEAPNAFVLVNRTDIRQEVQIRIKGSKGGFNAFRTDANGESYKGLGTLNPDGGTFCYTAPPQSSTTFFEQA